MVKTLLIISMLILSNIATAQDVNEDSGMLTGDKLKKLLKKGSNNRQSAADRFKASRINTKNLTVIKEKDLTYLLPNGKYVLGTLLSNGKVSPAIKTRFGTRPACVTIDWTLVIGTWDKEKEIIKCEIKASELAMVEFNVGQKGRIEKSNKYSSNINTNKSKNDKLTNEETKTENHKADPKISNKYTNNKYNKKTQLNKYGKNTKTSSHASSQYTYTPPPRNSTSANSKKGTLAVERNKYGISMGTWMKAELMRAVSSAESGEIELKLTESVKGRTNTLPADTILFAVKQFNAASKRLEGLTTTAILPTGEEFTLQAYIYATDKTAGLTGSIIRDTEGELLAAGTQTLLKTVTSALTSSNVAGQAANDFASELINNEKKNAPQTPQAVIEVAKQYIWLKLTKSI